MPTFAEISHPPVAIPERNYTARAVVDWVEIVVKLERASHGGYLKRQLESLGVSKVTPRNAGAGSAATEFQIDLQHPEKYAVVREVVGRLEKDYGFAKPPVVKGVEVSVDFWPKDGSAASGRAITERLMMSIAPPVIYNPHQVSAARKIELPDGREKINPEITLYIGNKNDDLQWRVYWKRTDDAFIGDDGKRVSKPLPESEWRARAEVCIKGKALATLGILRPDDLENVIFEGLHKRGYFKFGRYVEGVAVLDSNIWVRTAAEHLGTDGNSPACVLGMFGQRDKRRRRLKLSRYLETDMELTEAARHALRGLSKRF